MNNQEYRYHIGKGLRLKKHPLGEFQGKELRTEDFDDLQEFCLAVASELLETIESDREYHDTTGEVEE